MFDSGAVYCLRRFSYYGIEVEIWLFWIVFNEQLI